MNEPRPTDPEAGVLMAYPAVTIPAETTVQDAVRLFLHRYPFRAFPTLTGSEVVGLVTIERIDATLPAERSTTTVGEIAETAPDLFISEHLNVTELLERAEFRRVGRAVVLSERSGVGILSMTEIQRALERSE